MQASSSLLSQKSSKLIENVLNPLVKNYVQDLKDQNFWARVGRMHIQEKVQRPQSEELSSAMESNNQGQGKQCKVDTNSQAEESKIPETPMNIQIHNSNDTDMKEEVTSVKQDQEQQYDLDMISQIPTERQPKIYKKKKKFEINTISQVKTFQD